MGNSASLGVEAKRNARGLLVSRRIQGLELGKKSFFFISGVIISVSFTIYAKNLTNPLLFQHLKRILAIRIWSTAILTPLIEEFAKAYPLLHRNEDTKKSLITLGFLVGLGFGINEFFLYITQRDASIYIRLPVIFLHAATTAITAYGIKRDKPLLPYLTAFSLHSAYNLSGIYNIHWLTSRYPILLATILIAAHVYSKKSTPSLRGGQVSELLGPSTDEGLETIIV